VAGSEAGPSLASPQAGSTAAVGGNEGIYESMFGYTYVGVDGSIARKFTVGSLFGSIAVTGLNWVFNAGTEFLFVTASPTTGSGTFTPKTSMDGTYANGGGSPASFGPVSYSTANALAVSQASVAGTWTASDTLGIGISLTVDPSGAFTGTTSGVQIGSCTLSGTVALSEPGTAKNMYGLTLNAVNAAASPSASDACKLETTGSYTGPSAIVFLPAGIYTSNGYFRYLSFLARTSTGATLTNALRLQP